MTIIKNYHCIYRSETPRPLRPKVESRSPRTFVTANVVVLDTWNPAIART